MCFIASFCLVFVYGVRNIFICCFAKSFGHTRFVWKMMENDKISWRIVIWWGNHKGPERHRCWERYKRENKKETDHWNCQFKRIFYGLECDIFIHLWYLIWNSNETDLPNISRIVRIYFAFHTSSHLFRFVFSPHYMHCAHISICFGLRCETDFYSVGIAQNH